MASISPKCNFPEHFVSTMLSFSSCHKNLFFVSFNKTREVPKVDCDIELASLDKFENIYNFQKVDVTILENMIIW